MSERATDIPPNRQSPWEHFLQLPDDKQGVWRRVMTICRVGNNVVWPQCQTASEWAAASTAGRPTHPYPAFNSRPDFQPYAASHTHTNTTTTRLPQYSTSTAKPPPPPVCSICNRIAGTKLPAGCTQQWLRNSAIPFCLDQTFIIQTRR